ncbi:MAG: GGDEF domain-containing protein [Halieaceae bacterium]|jgi:diguanylate cyclase (GGDEF)-like protein|nr:GGDEF domain-containing protein [Halieaceae bacterium]
MKKVASITPNNLATHVTDAGMAHHIDALQRVSDRNLLQLHQWLQVTLSTGTLINRFLNWLSESQQVDGIEYVHLDENIKFSCGTAKHHRAHYVLRLEQRYLGEITLSSNHRFSDQDLYHQEQGMGVLVHYLKNAVDYQALEKLALQDSLTGVMNRSAMDELLPKETRRAQRYGYDLTIMMIDIDHFKSINDRIGHPGGDKVLRLVAQAIKEQLRVSDLPFRFGGDEFMVILPSTDLDGGHTAGRQIQQALAKLAAEFPGLEDINPQLSIGIATYQTGESADDLIRRVDNALYRAKEEGRNCVK